VLAVALFVAFWVIVAVGLFLIASRGSRGRDRAGGAGRMGSRSATTLFLLTAAVFGIALPLLVLTSNHSNADAHVGSGLKLTANEKTGRELFGSHCAVCHTLAAANAMGKVGPNLDMIKPSYSLVVHTINNGCLPNGSPSSGQACLGQGVMDPDIVQGADAQNVAAFVSKVAGQG
jgi:mono/diheme cytochrome c family protein